MRHVCTQLEETAFRRRALWGSLWEVWVVNAATGRTVWERTAVQWAELRGAAPFSEMSATL